MTDGRGWGKWLMVVLLMALPRSAWAANSASEIVALRQLWERAVAAEEQGDWVTAEQALSEAVGIKETPGLRYHLAHCREMQRKWVEALVDYKSVEEQILSGAKAPDVEPLLQAAIQRLEEQIPKLTIVVARVDGMSLHIDGQQTSVKLLGLPIALNPGGHRIALTAPGAEPAIRNISLDESEVRELSLTLVPLVQSVSPQQDAFSAKPYVMVAEAAVAVGALGFGLYHRLEADQAAHQGLGQFADKQNKLALGWTVGAGVAAAAFAATWILWSDEASSSELAYIQGEPTRLHAASVYLKTDWSRVTLEGLF
jgi:hypothetical protein